MQTDADEIRVRVRIRGRVQGVWFRGSARDQAERLGIRGWARNCPDGSVEILAQGPRDTVDELTRWCHQGPPGARVTSVETHEEPVGEELSGFEVRYRN